MQIKRFVGSVIAVGLMISLLWFDISPLSGLAAMSVPNATPARQSDPAIPVQIAQAETGEFKLPPLPYAYDALDDYIDATTMMIHHDRHHAGYVNNLNAAIAQHPDLQGKSLTELLQDLEAVPEDIRTTVRNNGGGHANHTLFWEMMTPNSPRKPTGALAQAIDETFGDFDAFKEQFNAAGLSRFGSGWAWLVLTQDGQLKITSTPNQDSPLLEGSYPILGNDVWEHAYYLKYQNKRADYLTAWWNVVNWDAANRQFEQAKQAV